MIKYILNMFDHLKKRPYWFIRLIISRILLKSRLCYLITMKFGGIKIRFFPTKFCADLWFPGGNAYNSYNLPFLKEGDTVIDVGANMGFTTLLFRKYIGASGKIYSFEPNPEVFKYLEKNISLNKFSNVFMYNYAAGLGSGKTFLQKDNKSDTGNKISGKTENVFTVNMDSLDNILRDKNIKKINLIKVDTEGYEKFVLEGAIGILEITDFIIFEAIEKNCNNFNYNLQEITVFLKSINFIIYSYNVNTNNYETFNIDRYLKYSGDYLYDLFAVKNPSLIEGVKWV